MHTLREALLGMLAMGTVLMAQGRPAGETKPASPLSARSAFALAVLEDLVRERDAAVATGRGPRIPRDLIGRFPMCGYTSRFVHGVGADGKIEALRSFGFNLPDRLDPERWGVYVVPVSLAGASQCAFFVAADGAVLFCDGRAQRYDAGHPPEPTAAFGRGGEGRWADRQRSAGMGEDGEFWQPASTLPRTQCVVTVTTDDGRPLDHVEVWVASATGMPALRGFPEGVPLAGAWPVGVVKVDEKGRGALAGVVADDLVVRVGLAGTMLDVPVAAVRAHDGQLHVALARADQRPERLQANESAAFATLKNITSAQAQCQAAGVIDADGDGAGEFGFFGELTGTARVRSDAAGAVGTQRIEPPVLSSAFQVRESRVMRGGYLFRIYLRDKAGNWVTEHADGEAGRGVAIDPDRAETSWCCLAWPVHHGWTGRPAFFVDQRGEVFVHANGDGAFTGAAAPLPWTAAKLPAGWLPHDSAPPDGR
ncbi:MAG: hypothetical protein WAT39_08435 [Planctomycetota bacterium]